MLANAVDKPFCAIMAVVIISMIFIYICFDVGVARATQSQAGLVYDAWNHMALHIVICLH